MWKRTAGENRGPCCEVVSGLPFRSRRPGDVYKVSCRVGEKADHSGRKPINFAAAPTMRTHVAVTGNNPGAVQILYGG